MMWLSKKITTNQPEAASTNIGYISDVNTTQVTVKNGDEFKDIPMLAPFGIAYVPNVGDKAIIMHTPNSDICAGGIVENSDLEPGEVMLYSSGGASIILKNSGEVMINCTSITFNIDPYSTQ